MAVFVVRMELPLGLEPGREALPFGHDCGEVRCDVRLWRT
jgi:hypothetical protein